MALQLGSKYFAKVSGVDGIIGSFGIFKKSESLAKNIDTVDKLLNSYWTYKNNTSLTGDQRFLLMAMKVTDAFLSKQLSAASVGDMADALEKILEKTNKYDNSIAKAEGIAMGFSTINVVDDCFWGCKIKSFELTPIFTYVGGGYADVNNILMKDLDKIYTTEANIAQSTKTKTNSESSAGSNDYEFLGLPMGLYMATVRYASGTVYRQPVHIDKVRDTYVVNTEED